MQSTMMDVPLLVSSVLRHAALYHGDTAIVSRSEGGLHRTTYATTWRGSSVGSASHRDRQASQDENTRTLQRRRILKALNKRSRMKMQPSKSRRLT